jgi:hypothetical protein
MNDLLSLICDGCGRPASSGHIARRLLRLQWSTRFRPVHIQTLFLGATAPLSDDEFPYSPEGKFLGEAAHLLKALKLRAESKTAEVLQAEIQRAGAFLTHIWECPPDPDSRVNPHGEPFLRERLLVVASRIRRSLRPKRVVPISPEFNRVLKEFVKLELGCAVLLNNGKAFSLEDWDAEEFATPGQEARKSPEVT